MSARNSAPRLGLGHFLERRKDFLDNISRNAPPRVNGKRTCSAQNAVMTILEKAQVPKSSPSADFASDPFGPNLGAHMARDVNTIRQMMACGMHLGHTTSRWNPRMAPYIFGERAGIHIINLERTLVCLRQACNVTRDLASRGGTILFVGTSESIQRLTYECAQDAGQFYVNTRWIGGTITNRTQVLRNNRLTPDLLVVLDAVHNKGALEEASTMALPTIAIADTNCDPDLITYPIPANDDAYASVELVARTLSAAAAEGRRIRTTKPLPSHEIFESANTFINKIFSSSGPIKL